MVKVSTARVIVWIPDGQFSNYDGVEVSWRVRREADQWLLVAISAVHSEGYLATRCQWRNQSEPMQKWPIEIMQSEEKRKSRM